MFYIFAQLKQCFNVNNVLMAFLLLENTSHTITTLLHWRKKYSQHCFYNINSSFSSPGFIKTIVTIVTATIDV